MQLEVIKQFYPMVKWDQKCSEMPDCIGCWWKEHLIDQYDIYINPSVCAFNFFVKQGEVGKTFADKSYLVHLGLEAYPKIKESKVRCDSCRNLLSPEEEHLWGDYVFCEECSKKLEEKGIAIT